MDSAQCSCGRYVRYVMRSESKSPGRVVVVGAGWVGSAIADYWAAAGYKVVATTRSGRPHAPPVSPQVVFAPFDLVKDNGGALAGIVAGADILVVCWAPAGRDADRRGLYLGGAQAVVEALAGVRPARLIYTSSTSALPDRNEELDEQCAEWPTTDRGRLQREAEEVILTGAQQADVPVAILRLAGLYGPGRELGRIYRRDSAAILSGSGCTPTNLIHREDVVSAIFACRDLPASWSGVIHVCADDHRSRREIFAEAARREGRAAPTWELPESPVTGKRVGNRRMQELLGVRLRYPQHQWPDETSSP
jgi:nucleoside-diphosphate-sugar epimerase